MSSKPRFAFFRRARFKLTLYYSIIQLLFFVSLGVFLYIRHERMMTIELEKFLKDESRDVMLFVLNHPDDRPAIERRFHYESVGERYYDLSFRLLDQSGKALVSSRVFRHGYQQPIRPEALQAALKGEAFSELVQVPDETSSYFLMTRPYDDPNSGARYIVETLASLEPLDKLSQRFRHNIISVLPLFLLISWVGGYALARKVLKPVNTIARTARQITSTRLDQRLDRSKSGDEFDMLAETLNEMIGRLEESFALLRQFATDAAHELRTPLTIMKGEAEIALRSNTDDPEAYRNALDSNIRECDRMIGIITNLLLLSQADTGDVPLDHHPLRLDQLLADIAENFEILASEKGTALEVPSFPEIVVVGDRSRLHELFANLLDNAVKYTPPGGTVGLSCEVGPQEVRVAVTDSGIGIPEDQQQKIFERFYRVDRSRSRETGGYGLGLSIARWVASVHGGRIELHSAPGAGSTFTVVLPLASAVHSDATAGA